MGTKKQVYKDLSAQNGAVWSFLSVIVVFDLIFSSFGFIEGVHLKNYLPILQAVFALILIGFFINAFYSGIIVDEEGITSYSLIKKRHFIRWQDINNIGVYRNTEVGYKNIPLAKAHKKIIYNINAVYVSAMKPKTLTNKFFKSENVVSFNYRKELFDFVQQKLNNTYPN
jgi:energy-coupling factor transporter transmembrane protein EcfT